MIIYQANDHDEWVYRNQYTFIIKNDGLRSWQNGFQVTHEEPIENDWSNWTGNFPWCINTVYVEE